MKLFQIEEPDGSPVDPDAPGVAVGIDIGGARADVAVAVGGNAVMLNDRDGFDIDLPVPQGDGSEHSWRSLFEGARLRAERALGQPVTHAVLSAAAAPAPAEAARLVAAAESAGIAVLRIVAQPSRVENPALAAAVLAEDIAPRPAAG